MFLDLPAPALDPARHTVIYLPNPTIGVRGIHHQIVQALGGQPLVHHATLVPQAADALATEHAERGRIPVLVIDLCRPHNYADVVSRQGRDARGGAGFWKRWAWLLSE